MKHPGLSTRGSLPRPPAFGRRPPCVANARSDFTPQPHRTAEARARLGLGHRPIDAAKRRLIDEHSEQPDERRGDCHPGEMARLPVAPTYYQGFEARDEPVREIIPGRREILNEPRELVGGRDDECCRGQIQLVLVSIETDTQQVWKLLDKRSRVRARSLEVLFLVHV